MANKLFYDILLDRVVCFYAAKGHPDGPVGYLAPLIKASIEALSDKGHSYGDLLSCLSVTSVLPFVDVNTGLAKKLRYTDNTRTMDVQAIVSVFDDYSDCTKVNCNNICTNLVCKANQSF